MCYFWAFVTLQCLFGIAKYGPYSDECRIFDDSFNIQCWTFPFYCCQLGTYVIILLLTCVCGCNQKHKIWVALCEKRCWACDQLLFPMGILLLMGISELIIGFSHPLYLIQFGIDVFGYALWFLYAPIFSNVLKQCPSANFTDINTRRIYMTHFIFVFISVFAIMWLLVTMFGEDFRFDIVKKEKLIFIQIILESSLIIEWMHLVLHDCMSHKDNHDNNPNGEKSQNKVNNHQQSYVSSVVDLQVDIKNNNKQSQKSHVSKLHMKVNEHQQPFQDDNKETELASKSVSHSHSNISHNSQNQNVQKDDKSYNARGELVGNWYFLIPFSLDILAVSIYGTIKTFRVNCSNYDLTIHDDLFEEKCASFWWITEFAQETISLR